MCGIIGVVRRRSSRPAPVLGDLVAQLESAAGLLEAWSGDAASLLDAAVAIEAVDTALRGVAGITALLGDRPGTLGIDHQSERISELTAGVELRLDHDGAALGHADPEA